MATFVLVHGAFIGGWAWRRVAADLPAGGHQVFTPTFTSHGERVRLARPEIGLDANIEDLVYVLRFEDLTAVVLVGWSYGGMVVAGVADRVPERIVHLVYLDSDAPRDGGGSSFPPSRTAERTARAHAYGAGWSVLLSPEFAAVLADLPTADRERTTACLTPQPLATWTQPIRLNGTGDAIPTTYVRCTVGYDPTDEDTRRQDARIRAEPGWCYRELAASHFAPLTAPQAMVDELLSIGDAP
jgi:pimeloyl-ACP methyl ester carboxylesterase